MATLLLIGPQGMGKTTLFQVARGNSAPSEHIPTQGISKKRSGFFFVRSFRDTPGADTTITDRNVLDNLISGESKIGYVFDMNEFLKELNNENSLLQGGKISSAMRVFWNVWSNTYAKSGKQLYFIGTHADEIEGGATNAKKQIIDKINAGNESYKKIATVKRYPFDSCFTNPACFHCVNATDSIQVKQLMDEIFKTK